MSEEVGTETATAPVAEEQATTPAAPAAEPATAATLGQTQVVAPSQTNEPWYNGLPDDLRGNEHLARYNTQEEALRGFVEAQKVIGKKEIINGLVAPGDNATDVERQAFQSQLNEMIGVPESVDKYTIGGQQLPENLNEFASIAHELNLSNDQFNGLAEGLTKLDEAMVEKSGQELAKMEEANLSQIKSDWGGQYDQNMAVANKALEAFGTDGLRDFIVNNGGTTDPSVLKFFHTLGSQLEEGALKIGDGVQTAPAQTDQQHLDSLMKSDEYWKPHLDGGITKRKVGELLKAQLND